MIHGINGEMLIPLVALILLIISFFAKVPEGPKWAAMLLRRHRRPGRAGHRSPTASRPSACIHGLLGAAAVRAGLPHRQAGRPGRLRPPTPEAATVS